ncbi:MAG: glutaredoxin [Cyclobacteriaceae bacterium]|nr:glutaredoxin [Cyclobacteriaceae bacterium]
MELHPNEMWLLFDPASATHRKTRVLAMSITKNVNEISLRHTKLTKMRWAELLALLNLAPKNLLDKSLKKYQEELAGHDFDDDDWLDILRNNPELVKAPLAVMNGRAILCNSPKDIYKLAPEGVQKEGADIS